MTVNQALNYTKQELQKAGVDDSAFDAIYLFEDLLKLSRTDIALNPDMQLNDVQTDILFDAIKKRVSGVPLQYILGVWDFMGRKYFVGEGVLIPRDDTQVVIDACACMLNKSKAYNIIDLCSGSGIIAVTLKKMFETSNVYAVEKSELALPYLKKNCAENNADVNIIFDDINNCFHKFENHSLDVIISNPPYIISDEIKTLQKEVLKEPVMALDGGTDGYDFYKVIIKNWSVKLKDGGIIALELGEGQFDLVSKLLSDCGYTDIRYHLDLNNTKRAVTAKYSKN